MRRLTTSDFLEYEKDRFVMEIAYLVNRDRLEWDSVVGMEKFKLSLRRELSLFVNRISTGEEVDK